MHSKRKRERKLSRQRQDEIREEVLALEGTRKFADPTYDVAFKILCANKEFLKHLINILLDFNGEKEIKDIEFLPQELVANHSMEQKVRFDLRCRTNHGEEIIVEMQRQYKKYFISRMQYYMARLVVNEIFAGESEQIHEKLKKIHILVISREKLINDKEYVKDDVYEQTVMPTIAEREHMQMFQNVMCWKFEEIYKFVRALEKGAVDLRNDKKAQLLYFFSNCVNISSMDEIPDYFDPNVKEAYKIMMKSNLEKEEKLAEYLEQTVEEKFDEMELREIEEAYKEACEEACKKAKIEGEAIGEAKGELKGKLEVLKNLIQQEVPHDILVKSIGILTEQQVSRVEVYVHEHGAVPVEELIGLITDSGSEHVT